MIEKVKTKTIKSVATLDNSSIWFSGHFPGDPILPGIAQLKLVADLISEAENRTLCLKRLGRIKFRKIVRPGESLNICVTSGEDVNHYLFSITSGNEDVCSGSMYFS